MSHFTKTLPAIGALCTMGLFAGCGGEGAASAETGANGIEPVELTVSSIFPDGSTASILLDEWMTEVTEATEGAVTFEYYSDATLHPATEAISAMQSGLTDITFVNNGTFPEQLPVSNWDDLTVQTAMHDFGYPNINIAGIGSQAVRFTDDNVAVQKMQEQGFRPLLPMISGPAALHCTEPFETAEDLAGRQVRVPNQISEEENKALGMTPMFLPTNEQYEALQRGVIDCAINSATTLLSSGLVEVSPYVAFTNNAPSAGANWVISTSTWDSLSTEVQQIFIDALAQPTTNYAINTLDVHADTVMAVEEAGGEIIDASKLNPALAEYWANRPDLASVAPDAVEDPEAAIAHTNQIVTAWQDASLDDWSVPVDHDDIIEVLGEGSDIIEWDGFTQAIRDTVGTK